MTDKLHLTDSTIPIQQRYDSFLVWCNEHPSIIPDVIAVQLGVDVSVVDVFLLLGELEEEFDLIDEKKISIGVLFIIIRYSANVRAQVYENADALLSQKFPMNVVKAYVDTLITPNFNEIINKISANAWMEISKYLTARNITDGTISLKFRGMLKKASRMRNKNELISDKMCDWIVRAINKDIENGHGIFTNETLLQELTEDYNHLDSIILQIGILTE